jgi:toxin-antitoxin system PIN domain toxin
VILLDVNILVYAHRKDLPQNPEIRQWLETRVNSDQAFGLADLALSGFIRVVTNPRAFKDPTPLPRAVAEAQHLRNQPNCVVVAPGSRHWDIFTALAEKANARGNMVPDAYFAALAIESGSEWITTDRGFGRYPDLDWRHPLD